MVCTYTGTYYCYVPYVSGNDDKTTEYKLSLEFCLCKRAVINEKCDIDFGLNKQLNDLGC